MPRSKSTKPRKPKTFHFDSWFMNKLRGITRTWPPIYTARNRGKEEYFVLTKMGKQSRRVRHTCSECKQYMKNDEVRIDHIIPIIPIEGPPLLPNGKKDWNIIIERMLCSEDNLNKICKTCHDRKSKREAAERAAYRKSLTKPE